MPQPPVDSLKPDLARGCARAYAELYDLLGPAMLKTATTMLHSAAEAEDSVQDVFVSLMRSRHRMAAIEDLRAYLFSSLRHAILRRRRQRESDQQKLNQIARQSPNHHPAPTSADDELEQALANLPDEQREVITLKIDADLTFAQIAAILKCSPNTAASRYRYAIENLRRELKGDQ